MRRIQISVLRLSILLCLAVAGLAVNTAANADPTLDQIHEIFSGSGPEAREGRMLAQTFTVGLTGTLVYADMWLWDSGGPATEDLIVEIWSTNGGLPQAGALAQVILTPDEVQDVNNRVYTRADLTGAGLHVVEGDVLAIVLRSEAAADPGGYDWWGDRGAYEIYSRGNGFQSYDEGVTWEQSAEQNFDYMFRTYVEVTDPSVLLTQLYLNVIGVGSGKSLANKVKLAQVYYAANDMQATCAVLTDFVIEVRAQRGKKIKPTALADELITDAQAIMTAIGCN